MECNHIETIALRAKNELTIPKKTREFMDIKPGDLLGFEINQEGQVCLHKIKPVKLPNNNNGEGNHTQRNPISPQTKKNQEEMKKNYV